MSSLKQRPTGTRYTATVALILAGLVLSPLALYISWPVSYGTVSLAVTFSVACLISAWFQWKNRSRLTVPSLALRFKAGVASKTLLLCFALSAFISSAENLSSYRGFEFGSSIATVSKQAGLQPKDSKIVHEQPALIQMMSWQPRYEPRPDGKPDSVREGTFSFLNGQLYQIVVVYDRYQIEGMTADDMIAAISQSYGAASHPKAEIAFPSLYGDTAAVLARWEDATSVYNLVPTEDKSSFALVLYAKSLNAAATVAIAEARRLEELAAPQRAKDEELKRIEDDRLAIEKTRATNKPNFRP